MVAYRRWVFEVDAPVDEFLHRVQRSLVLHGLALERAKRYDFGLRGWGARGYVKVNHHEDGLEMVVKLKAALFGSTPALEDALLAAGRAAQAQILFDETPVAAAPPAPADGPRKRRA